MTSAVVDVNVLVSSVLVASGNPRRVLEAWHADRFVLKTSMAIIADVEEKLRSSRIAHRYHLTEDQISSILALLRAHAELVVVPADDVPVVAGDPEDDGVLAACRLGHVAYLVTGDHGLLDLREYAGVRIVSPRAFLETFGERNDQ